MAFKKLSIKKPTPPKAGGSIKTEVYSPSVDTKTVAPVQAKARETTIKSTPAGAKAINPATAREEKISRKIPLKRAATKGEGNYIRESTAQEISRVKALGNLDNAEIGKRLGMSSANVARLKRLAKDV